MTDKPPIILGKCRICKELVTILNGEEEVVTPGILAVCVHYTCRDQQELPFSGSEMCKTCAGAGSTAEHSSTHGEDGECVECPIQVQCEPCQGTGKITAKS